MNMPLNIEDDSKRYRNEGGGFSAPEMGITTLLMTVILTPFILDFPELKDKLVFAVAAAATLPISMALGHSSGLGMLAAFATLFAVRHAGLSQTLTTLTPFAAFILASVVPQFIFWVTDSREKKDAADLINNISHWADERDLASLEKALIHSEKDVNHAAVAALVKIGGHDAADVLLNNARGNFGAVYLKALKSLKEFTFDALVERLDSDDPEVREQAISALAHIGDKRVMGQIFKLLGDSNFHVKLRAIWAAETFRDSSVLVELEKLLEGSDTRVLLAVINAISELGGPTDIEVFEGLIENPDWSIRNTLKAALNRVGSPEAREMADRIDLEVKG
jgi:hypothetical protein